MKLSCSQEELAKGLSTVMRAVATRSTLPVLYNVLLATDNGRLKLAATNLELGIQHWIEAVIEEEGATTVPARSLTDLVNTLPAAQIDLELIKKTETLKLQCQKMKANFKGITADEFPVIPVAKDVTAIDTNLFQEMVSQVSMAAARDESRPILAGILMKFEQGKLTMAAADGFRLSTRSAELKGSEEDGSFVVPCTALQEAARLKISSFDLRDNQVIFQGENGNLVSQLIAGNFPDYERIIPQGFETEIVVGTRLFLSACKKAQIFAREAANLITLEIKPDSITLLAKSAEFGDSQDVIPASVTGNDIEVALNAKYLMDALSIMPTDNTILKMKTSTEPVTLVPDSEDTDLVMVIMPMNIR